MVMPQIYQDCYEGPKNSVWDIRVYIAYRIAMYSRYLDTIILDVSFSYIPILSVRISVVSTFKQYTESNHLYCYCLVLSNFLPPIP